MNPLNFIKQNRNMLSLITLFASSLGVASAQDIEMLTPVTISNDTSSAPIATLAEASGAISVQVNVAQINALPLGSEVTLSLPGMRQYTVVYERLERHGNNASTWVGYLKDYGNNYRVIITSDVEGSFGRMLTPDGEFLLKMEQGGTWLFDVNASSLKPFQSLEDDVVIPPMLLNEQPSSLQPESLLPITLNAIPSAMSTIDVMVIYTDNLVSRLGSVSAVETRINYLIALSNQAYIDSGVGAQLSLVHSEAINYDDAVNQGTSLDDLTNGTGTLSSVAALRDSKGADLVVLLHPFNLVNSSCGLAWLGGYNGSPIADSVSYGYSVSADGTDPGGATYCSDYTFIHELGHNMGSKHDRVTSAGDSYYGAYPYSYGYGVDNQFATIMAYPSSFAGRPDRVGKFSTPLLSSCQGLVCGIDSQLTDSSDNALSLNNTRDAVANFRATVTPVVLDTPTASAATQVTASSFTANWNSVSNAAGYYLDVSTNNTFASYVSPYQSLDVGNSTAYSVTGLGTAIPYYYRVRAYSGQVSSADSNTIGVTTLVGTGDTDQDGMSDSWEVQYGLNPNDSSDASLDNDNDGYSNLEEFNGGSSPLDINDTPAGSCQDPNAVTISLGNQQYSSQITCQASDTIYIGPNVSFANGTTAQLTGGVSVQASSDVTVDSGAQVMVTAPLIRLLPTVHFAAGSNVHLQSTQAPVAKAYRLNDTGITTCSNDTQNGLTCPVSTHPGQDAEYGRDVTHNDDGDGHAGFSFTKLDANGQDLPATATAWRCVRDNVTGLIWEVKTSDGGLQDKNNTYSWYNSDASLNGGDAGMPNGGTCTGSNCDTESYVQAVNAQGLCGASDWRMPNILELPSIVDHSKINPAIDTLYFPNTVSFYVWSSFPNANGSGYAWDVYFGDGYVGYSNKYSSGQVRLVRGGQ